jgi:predicted PurR-regulated permease PerM
MVGTDKLGGTVNIEYASMKSVPVQISSYAVALMLLAASIHLNLVSALFAGMLVFTLIDKLSPMLSRLFSGRAAQIAATAIVAVIAVTAVSASAFTLLFYLKNGESTGLPQLWIKLAEIIEGANTILPPWVVERLPGSADDWKTIVVSWLHTHSAEIQGAGKEIGVAFVHVLIGGILGAMIAVGGTCESPDRKPLAAALRERVGIFYNAFQRVVIGQGKISLINTSITAVYLAIVLPAAGIHLPFIKTILIITLIVGILPVVGNLISNTVIVVVSASVSFNAALASLAFLVVLHKSEYFLSAKILGHQINAKAWEMLLAMLLMEAAFGVPGIAVAPVFYAYLKAELMRLELI